MAESLRAQLLKAGLAKSAPAGKRKKSRQKAPDSDLARAWKAREREERQAAKERRRIKQAEQQRRRALNRKLWALVEPLRLNLEEAEINRNFIHHGRIRKIRVTAQQLVQLNNGQLGLVYLRGRYHLLAAADIERVKELSAGHVVDLDTGQGHDEDEFPVPDDLIW